MQPGPISSFLFLPGLILAALLAISPRTAAAAPGLYGESFCGQPGYHCLTVGVSVVEKKVKTGKGEKTVTRKVRDSWESLWPDEREREIVMKLNRMNVRLQSGMVLAVPDDMDGKTFMDFAPFPASIEPECEIKGEPACRLKCVNCDDPSAMVVLRVCEQECAPGDNIAFRPDGSAAFEKVIIFDPAQLAWGAYDENGELVRWGPGAGGRDWCPDVRKPCHTVTGTFTISRKYNRWAVSSLFPLARQGKKAGGAPVPYFMRFSPGYGLHASSTVPGRHASHGCVRLFFEDAEWLNRDFAEIGTTVMVRPYQ